MPTYGHYETVRRLDTSPFGVVSAARRADIERECVVKTFQPDPNLFPAAEIDRGTAAFLERAKVQQKVAASGSSNWAPIHELGTISGGAFYVTTLYPQSAAKLLTDEIRPDAGELFSLLDGAVRGLRELKQTCGRAHGNLKPSNILIERDSGTLRVFLTDPADDAKAAQKGAEANDTFALGQLLCEWVTGQSMRGSSLWPIGRSEHWNRLGRSGEDWRELCNGLMHPHPAEGISRTDHLAERLGHLAPRKRRSPLPIVLAVAAMVTIACVLVFKYGGTTKPVIINSTQQDNSVAATTVGPTSATTVPIPVPDPAEKARRFREWVAALGPPASPAPALQNTWQQARDRLLTGKTDIDPAVQEQLDALRLLLDGLNDSLFQGATPNDLAAPVAKDAAQQREALVAEAAGRVTWDGPVPGLELTDRADLRNRYSTWLEQRLAADAAAAAEAQRKEQQLADQLKKDQEAAAEKQRQEQLAAKTGPAARIAALKQLFADDKITDEQLTEGKRLLSASDPGDETAVQKARVYSDLADGVLLPRYLQAALDAIETPEQREARLAKEAAAKAEADKQARITSLLATANANDNKEQGHDALAALDELLQLDSANAQAEALRDKITAYYGPRTVTNSIQMKLIEIKPGTFEMGSPAGETGRFDNETQHKVTLTKGFFMGATHVTVGQFAAFVNDSGYRTDAEKDGWAFAFDGTSFSKVNGASWRKPGFDEGDDHPVVDVSWNGATAFCDWLSKKEGKHYRLPTEAEWEYSARAETQTAYWWGDNPDDGAGCANCADQTAKQKFPNWGDYFSWTDGYVFTSPVGKFKPNAFGLYDMIGNAWEWCSDWYGDYPNGDATDPKGPENGQARVLRGGSWNFNPRYCRCAYRIYDAPDLRVNGIGFRIVLDSE